MWLGELITQRGIGNGMSILIFTSVISRLPSRGRRDPRAGRPGKFIAILLPSAIGIIVAVIYIDRGSDACPSSTRSAWSAAG